MGTVYRDANGRFRREVLAQSADEVVTNMVYIFDPMKQAIHVLDVLLKTIVTETIVHNIGTPSIKSLNSAMQNTSEIQGEEIGARSIEGLTCHGYRRHSGDSVVESWHSNELGEVLLEDSTGKYQRTFLRLFDIRQVEPDSYLFTLPADFKNLNAATRIQVTEVVSTTRKDKDDSLIHAAAIGDTESVRALLTDGADVNAKNEYGETALLKATEFGRTDTVKLLLAMNADVDAKSDYGATALMRSSWSGNTDAVHALLEWNSDPNLSDINGETALTLAAFHGHVDVVKALLEKGAKANAQDNNGTSALMRAVASGDVEIVRALLTAGANVQTKSSLGHTALGDAVLLKRSSIIPLLKEAEAAN